MRYLKVVLITLMFAFAGTAMAATDLNKAEKEYTVKGIIVKLDKEKGVGTLLEQRTNKLVSFRFSKDMKEKNIDTLKIGVDVEFTYVKGDSLTASK